MVVAVGRAVEQRRARGRVCVHRQHGGIRGRVCRPRRHRGDRADARRGDRRAEAGAGTRRRRAADRGPGQLRRRAAAVPRARGAGRLRARQLASTPTGSKGRSRCRTRCSTSSAPHPTWSPCRSAAGGNTIAVALGFAGGRRRRCGSSQARRAERSTTWASAIRIADPAHAEAVAALVASGGSRSRRSARRRSARPGLSSPRGRRVLRACVGGRRRGAEARADAGRLARCLHRDGARVEGFGCGRLPAAPSSSTRLSTRS